MQRTYGNINQTIRPLTYSSLLLLFLNSTFAVLMLIVLFILWYDWWQKCKMDRLKMHLSAELHDEVGSLLTGLAMQAELLERTAVGKQVEQLHRIADTSRRAMLNMRDVVWFTDCRKATWDNLIDRINEFALETLTPKGIYFEILTEGLQTPEKRLPLEIRKELYLICKEAMANVAKHSNGTEVYVQFNWTRQKLELSIKDNGQLEDVKLKHSGTGLSNMKMRAHRMDAQLSFRTDDGFEVRLVK